MQGTGYIKMKVAGEQQADMSPLAGFLAQEFEFGVSSVQTVHQTLSAVTRVIKGATSPSSATIQLINSLVLGKVTACALIFGQVFILPLSYDFYFLL